MVDVTLNVVRAGETGMVKLQGEGWELNVRAAFADLARLRDVRDASWDNRRSLAIGQAAGASVFWCSDGDQAMILVGHDDETWDIALTVPLATTDLIASLAEQELSPNAGAA